MKRSRPWLAASCLAGLCLALMAGTARAEPGAAFARVHQDPTGPVIAGQAVRVTVEVFVPTWFTGAPSFPDLDVPGAVVIFTGRGTNLSERIDGNTFAGQSRDYLVYPQAAGLYEIDAIPVAVRYAVDARPGPEVTLSPGAIRIEARVPQEAQGLEHFLATSRFEVETTVEGDPSALAVGDAIERTITMRAEQAFAMMLPPLSFDVIDGIEFYPGAPTVRDEGGERGQLRIGERTESVTYVMQEAGSYVLPEIEIAWWNTAANHLERSTVPALQLTVAAGPGPSEEMPLGELAGEQVETARRDPSTAIAAALRRWGARAVLLLVVAALGLHLHRRYLPRIRAAVAEVRQRRVESEARHYRSFRRAARAGRSAEAFRMLMVWLDRVRPGAPTLTDFVAASGDPVLEREATGLTDRLFSPGERADSKWSGAELERHVHAARRRDSGRPTDEAEALPPLNPPSALEARCR